MYRNYYVSSTSFSRVHVFLSDQDVGVYYLTITLLPSNIRQNQIMISTLLVFEVYTSELDVKITFFIKIHILAQHFKVRLKLITRTHN